MALTSTEEWESHLRKILEGFGEHPREAVASSEDFVSLDGFCLSNQTFKFILRCFLGYSTYLQSLRSFKTENVRKLDWNRLQRVEVLKFPTKENYDKATWSVMKLYWSAIKESLSCQLPLCTVLRSVNGCKSKETSYRILTECDEIVLNLLRDYIKCENSIAKELYRQVLSDSEISGMSYIQEAIPTFQEMFSTVGNSCYFYIYTYLPQPKFLNENLPGLDIKISKYLRPIVQEIINIPVAERLSIILPRYGNLSLKGANIVRRELAQVLTHVPFIIQGFWEQCSLLPMTVMFSFLPKDMVDRVMEATDCSFQEASSLIERLGFVIGKYKRIGINWETVSRADLIGVNLLLQKGLLTIVCRGSPTLGQLSILTSIIVSGRTIKGLEEISETHRILSLIIHDIYLQLNEACFRAKLNLMASLVSYRVALENSWDFHTYLLRRCLYEHLRPCSPIFKDHETLIQKCKIELDLTSASSDSDWVVVKGKAKPPKLEPPNTKRLNEKIKMIKSDMKSKKINVFIVMMEIEEKLRYIAKTHDGERINLIESDSELDVQGLDLTDTSIAKSLCEKLVLFLKACPKLIRGCSVALTLGLITSTDTAGGVLAVSIGKLATDKVCNVFTLPDRILTFYDEGLKLNTDADVLLEQAWNCFSTNTGHMSLHISRIRMEGERNQDNPHPLTEWEYQAAKNIVKPLNVLSVLLHVAVVNTRLCFQRCCADPVYASSMQFLLKCSDKRMEEIQNLLTTSSPHLMEHKARETLIRKFSKCEVLRFIGLSNEETERYAQFFYWEELYPYDKDLENQRKYFNSLISENDKDHLYGYLKKMDKDKKKLQSPGFYQNQFIQHINNEAWFRLMRFDPNIEARVKTPDKFFEGEYTDGGNWMAKFGSQIGEIFKNVDLFSFKCKDTIKFCVQHLPIGYYLRPLVACFPEEFPDDVIADTTTIDTSDDTTKVAKAQAFVMCALNKYMDLVLSPQAKGDYVVNPMFAKKINSIIINLEPPSYAHRFDLLATLLNLTYLDSGSYERVAGRVVSVNEFKRNDEITDVQFEGFQKAELNDTEKRFQFLSRNRIPNSENLFQVITSTNIPYLNDYFVIKMNKYVRLKLLPSKRYGGFPFHLEVENPEEVYKMI